MGRQKVAASPDNPIVPTGAILSEEEVRRILKEQPGKAAEAITLTSFQREVLLRQEKEIGCFGGRYGGKSYAARAFLLKGNPDLPNYDENGQQIWANISYIYHPSYHAIIVRKNRLDLEDFVKKFAVMVKPFGGQYKNGRFEFPSGAWIDCGHMEDSDAWMKYVGVEATRFVFEEATLIPEEMYYIQVLLSCRSVHPELRPQVLLTSNAIGPGFQWITERFIEAKDSEGNIIPPGTTITDTFENPFTGEKVTSTRVWLKSTVMDNPYAASDPSYIATLASIKDEKMRRAYLLGDWVSMTGTYFGDIFRPKGPVVGDPENANHVLHPPYPILQPWWHQSIGCDWGRTHEAAVYWLTEDPNNHRLHVHRELVASGVDPEPLGYEIALRTKPDLMAHPGKSIIMHLSPDAFQDRMGRNRSIAELIAIGMTRVLGAKAVHLPDVDLRAITLEARSEEAAQAAARQYMEEVRVQRRAGIIIRIANDSRVIGWQFIREAMRFRQIGEEPVEFNQEFAEWLWREKGEAAYLEYWSSFKGREVEVLPKLQIWDCCPRLISAIPKAIHSELNPEDVAKKHFVGMDSLDACFVAGTLIRTESGEIPIESVRVGDKVWTRKGLRRVSDARVTNENAIVFTVRLSNGKFLTGTGSHPVWKEGVGFVRLDTLRYGDIIKSWKPLNLTDIGTTASPTAKSGTCGFTFGPSQNSAKSLGSKDSTKKFGRQQMDQFQQGISSTIWTATPSIMISPTWIASGLRNICQSISLLKKVLGRANMPWKFNLLPKNGMLQRRGVNGIVNMLIAVSQNPLKLVKYVKYVGQRMWLSDKDRKIDKDSVPINVEVLGEEASNSILSKSSAYCVEQRLSPINTTTLNTAPTVVLGLSPAGSALVYNLSVDDAEEYFANGILVHNCRYLLIGHRDEPIQEPFESFQTSRLEDIMGRHPEYTGADLVWVQRHIQEEWDQRKRIVGTPFNRPGAVSGRRMLGRGPDLAGLPMRIG